MTTDAASGRLGNIPHRAQVLFKLMNRKRPVFVPSHMSKPVCHFQITKQDRESNEDHVDVRTRSYNRSFVPERRMPVFDE